MKKVLNDIFDYRTIATCLIAAIGYGLGYIIPEYFGCHIIICLICCYVSGLVFETIAEKALTIDSVNESKLNKFILICIIYLTYIFIWILVKKLFGYDLDYELMLDLLYVVVFQFVSFAMHEIKKKIFKKENDTK